MSNEGKALNYDTGKLKLHLLDIESLYEAARVLDMGKYPAFNWRKGMEYSRNYNSMMRHALAFWEGEDKDKESDCYHLAHVIVRAMFLLWHLKNRPDLDDRYRADEAPAQGQRPEQQPSMADMMLSLHMDDTEINYDDSHTRWLERYRVAGE